MEGVGVTDPFDGWYQGRRVLVTGHTGFKGSWLSVWLHRLGAEVVGLALDPPTRPNAFEVLRVDRLVHDIRCDVRDATAVADVVDAYRPEMVFHLAAQPLVGRSWTEPRLTVETNVMGTTNVADAAVRSPGMRALVMITSDKCYENHEWPWPYRETDVLGGHDPYSASKAAAELVLRAWKNPSLLGVEQAPAVVSVRAGNVVGGGDWAGGRLIPDLVRSVVAGTPLILRDPVGLRPWQHVLEALSGYLWVGAVVGSGRSVPSDAFNFGPDPGQVATPAAAVVELALQKWGAPAHPVLAAELDPGREARLLRLDISRAGSELGWRPVWAIERTVEATIEWYRAHHDGHDDLLELSLRQIDGYLADARTAALAWASPSSGSQISSSDHRVIRSA
jgi:CDP-glucose 4,6-dehydratase